MTASAVSVNFELRSAFAIVAAELTLTRVPRGLPTKGKRLSTLGRADALLGQLAAQQTRAARLQGLLHVHVGAGQLAPALQDLGVGAMAVQQALALAQRLEPADRPLEVLPLHQHQCKVDFRPGE